MKRINLSVVLLVWIVFPFLLILSSPVFAFDCDSCMRKVLVRSFSENDPNFNTSVFLQHFGSHFRSPCVLLGENLSQPEYVLAATFIKDVSNNLVHLGITLGFVGGKVENPSRQREWWTQTYYYYFGDMIRIMSVSTEGDSLSDLIPLMVKKIGEYEPIEQTMRRYEQIPMSAEVEHDLDCEARSNQFDLHSLDSGYPGYGFRSSHDVRLVVYSENGHIEKGVPLEEDDKYRVIELSPPLNSLSKINFLYHAPEGEDKSDTIIFYNSCDILHEDVLPLSRTKKNKEISRIEIRCVWEGTIESWFRLSSVGDQSLITAMMPKSKYQGTTNWKLDVVFKLDRGNERVKIYELESARFDFLDQLEAEIVMQKPERKLQLTGKDEAEASGRKLSASECDLELIIDLKKKTYKIEGVLHVENIKVTADGRLIVDFGPIQHDQTDKDEGATEYTEEILIERKFSEEIPEKLEGSIDEWKELPPDFVEFTEALAGKALGKIRWKLEWKGKQK
ncbi:MAG: hypothetical protein JSV17_13965 [Candidatus Aminicenantes bacterium]|nr:MAG: hypothetical protein JSV17_13965 [Candidatus Aminicenantes bacterium]